MIDGVSTRRVVRPNHPFFPWHPRAWLALTVAMWSVGGHPASATTNPSYRLAGVVAVGNDYIAFLELPDGAQVLVRQGTVIEGGGRILLLDAERLRIGLPSGVVELVLEGSGRPAAVPVALGVVQEQSDRDNVLVRKVDVGRLGESLDAVPVSDATRTKPSTATAQRLAPIINLPPNSNVVAVNEQPVTSADTAIALIERALLDDVTVRLNLAGANGGPDTRVYLAPARD